MPGATLGAIFGGLLAILLTDDPNHAELATDLRRRTQPDVAAQVPPKGRDGYRRLAWQMVDADVARLRRA